RRSPPLPTLKRRTRPGPDDHRIAIVTARTRLIVVLYPQFDSVQGIARYLDSFLGHLPPGAPPVVLITGRLLPGLGPWPGVEVLSIPVADNRLGLLRWGWAARRRLQQLLRERGPAQAVLLHMPPLIPGLLLPPGLPLVLTPHSTYLGISGRFDPQDLVRSRWNPLSVALKRMIEHHLLAQARTVITLTERGRQELARYGRHDGIAVIPNGVDLSRFHPAADDAARDIDVLFCGRLEREKGSVPMAELCRALVAQRPQVRIAIVGDGSDGPRLRATLRDLAAHITWAGRVPFGDIAPWYRRSRVYASTSYYEGLPGTCLEAMACGLPAAVWERPFYRGLVVPGHTGLTAPVDDVAALAAQIGALLDDPPRAAALGRHGAELVRERHDWRRLAVEVLQACTALPRRPQGTPVAAT
ncbi:MAG: glycosyltransferase family 4 protein, partial [Rubrivivax sp.]